MRVGFLHVRVQFYLHKWISEGQIGFCEKLAVVCSLKERPSYSIWVTDGIYVFDFDDY